MATPDVPFKFYIAALLLAIAVPLVGALAWVSYRNYEEDRRDAENLALRSAQLSAAQISAFIRESEDLLRRLSQRPRIRALDKRRCSPPMEAVNEVLTSYSNVITRDIAGNLVCSAVPPKAGERPLSASRQYLDDVLRTGRFTIARSPVRSKITGEWVIALAYPLRDAQDRIAGILALALDLKKFHEIASGVALIKGTKTQILTGDGIVISSSHDRDVLIGQDVRDSESFAKMQSVSEGIARARDASGTERIYGFTAVPGTGWRVYAGIPSEVVLARSMRNLWRDGIFVTAIVVLASLLFALLARNVARAIGNIARAATAVAAGDRAARAESDGPREFRMVATQFNNMLDVLRSTEIRLSGIIASAMDPIIVINERHEITLVNAAVGQMFGYAEAELLGKPLDMLIPERYHQAHGEHVRRFARTGITRRAMGGFGEIVARRAGGGGEFPIDASISKMEWSGQQLFTVILRDVTRRIEAEKALRENEERLRLAVDSGGVGIWEWDIAANRLAWNVQASALLELAGDYSVSTIEEFIAAIHPEDRAGFRQAQSAALENHTEFEREFRIVRATGEVRWAAARARGAYDTSGKPVRMVGALLDVTESTLSKHELERKTAIAELLGFLARTASMSATPEEAMQICLTEVCKFGNWAIGRVAMTHDLSGNVDRFGDSIWHEVVPGRREKFMRASQVVRQFPVAGPLVGVMLGEGRPAWIPDILDEPGFRRRTAALADGLRSAFAFPVVARGKVVAFLEFYDDAPRAKDEDLVRTSESIAAQLAHLIERRQAEQINARFAAIVENSYDAIVSCSLDREVLSWNAAAERMFGYTAAEMVGRSISTIIPADQVARADRQRKLLDEGLQNWVYDAVRVAKDGRRIDVSISRSPIKDAGGQDVGVSLMFRDIGERRRAEVERAQMAAIVESSNDAILIRGPDRTILSWNAAAERLFGWSRQEAIGRSVDLILPPERKGGTRNLVEKVGKGGVVSAVDTVYLHKNGTRIPTRLTISPVRDAEGNFIAHSFTVADMSEIRRGEEALRRSASQLSDLSQRLMEVEENERRAISRELHDRIGQDLSTLTILIGSLASWLSPKAPDEIRKHMQEARSLLKSTVGNVRDVMAELRPPVLDDFGLLAALRHLVAEFDRHTGIFAELSGVHMHPHLPPLVETAMYRISQEALTNIAKHAHAKRVEISFNVVGERVVLEIADDGVGFDAGEIADAAPHWGMITMRERADAVGMVFRAESMLGEGTRIVLEYGSATP